MSAHLGGTTDVDAPRPDAIERFTQLFHAHLSQASTLTGSPSGAHDARSGLMGEDVLDPVAELDALRATMSSPQRIYFDRLAEQLRRQFHSSQERRRQAQLHSLLVQLPPFSLSEQDRQRQRTVQARQQRLKQVRTFAKRFATRSNVGVWPFFASLRRLFEAQAHDRAGRPLQWLLDDAVLMEAGGDDFLRSAVYTLKGVLHFQESKPADANPFADPVSKSSGPGAKETSDEDILRIWTVPAHLSNPECAALARAIPSHVLPRRGRGSLPAFADGALLRLAKDDEERQAIEPVPLPTGMMRYAPHTIRRDDDFRGGWMEWLVDCVLSVIWSHGRS